MDIRTWQDADRIGDGAEAQYRPRHRSKRSPFSPLRPVPIAFGGMTTAALAAFALVGPGPLHPGNTPQSRTEGLGAITNTLVPGPASPSSAAPAAAAASAAPAAGSAATGPSPAASAASVPTSVPSIAPSSSASTAPPTNGLGEAKTAPPSPYTQVPNTQAPSTQAPNPVTSPKPGAPVPPAPPVTTTPVPPTAPPTVPPIVPPKAPPPAAPPVPAPFNAAAAQANALAEIATARRAAGNNALRTDSGLTAMAAQHTADMVASQTFSHVGSSGDDASMRALRDGCTGFSKEIIARGNPGDDLLAALLRDASAGRALTSFWTSSVGISAQQDPKTGQVVWTIELGWL